MPEGTTMVVLILLGLITLIETSVETYWVLPAAIPEAFALTLEGVRKCFN